MPSIARALTLRASAAQAAAGTVTGTGVDVPGLYRELVVVLDVTAAGTDVGDTLDVYVDTSFDGGTTWINIGHFTQVLGNGGAKSFAMALRADNPGASAVYDISTNANAGATRQIGFGSKLRYRGVFVDANANGSMTYSVIGYVK